MYSGIIVMLTFRSEKRCRPNAWQFCRLCTINFCNNNNNNKSSPWIAYFGVHGHKNSAVQSISNLQPNFYCLCTVWQRCFNISRKTHFLSNILASVTLLFSLALLRFLSLGLRIKIRLLAYYCSLGLTIKRSHIAISLKQAEICYNSEVSNARQLRRWPKYGITSTMRYRLHLQHKTAKRAKVGIIFAAHRHSLETYNYEMTVLLQSVRFTLASLNTCLDKKNHYKTYIRCPNQSLQQYSNTGQQILSVKLHLRDGRAGGHNLDWDLRKNDFFLFFHSFSVTILSYTLIMPHRSLKNSNWWHHKLGQT